MEAPGSHQGPRGDSKEDVAGPGDLNVDLGLCLPPRPDLPLPREDGDGSVTGGAVDAFPVIGWVAEPALTDAFWVVATVG